MGLFHASRELRDAGLVDVYEEEQLISIRDWFDENLKKPHSFSKSKKPNAKGVAISWFKDSAVEHIRKMYEMKTIIEDHGLVVDVVRTEKPGYVVYEDQYQVTAQPYAETSA